MPYQIRKMYADRFIYTEYKLRLKRLEVTCRRTTARVTVRRIGLNFVASFAHAIEG